jgi:hypothetical protein
VIVQELEALRVARPVAPETLTVPGL